MYVSAVSSLTSKNIYGTLTKRFEENTAWSITKLIFLPDRKNHFVSDWLRVRFFLSTTISRLFFARKSFRRVCSSPILRRRRATHARASRRANNRQMVAARWTRSREVARSFWLYGKRRWDKLLRDQGIRTISGTVSRNGSDAGRRLDPYSPPTRPPDDHLTFTPSFSCSMSPSSSIPFPGLRHAKWEVDSKIKFKYMLMALF